MKVIKSRKMEPNSRIIKEVVKMSLTQQSLFWTKCIFCLDEIGYTYIKRKCNLRCLRHGRIFSTKENNDNE